MNTAPTVRNTAWTQNLQYKPQRTESLSCPVQVFILATCCTAPVVQHRVNASCSTTHSVNTDPAVQNTERIQTHCCLCYTINLFRAYLTVNKSTVVTSRAGLCLPRSIPVEGFQTKAGRNTSKHHHYMTVCYELK